MAICQKVLDGILDKLDRSEVADRRKEQKRKVREENTALKQERAKISRLEVLLRKRKETLKKDMARKRSLLEKELLLEAQSTRKTKRKFESEDEVPRAKKRRVEEVHCVCKTPYDVTR